jgi:dihydroneopterin aldolase
MSLFAQKTIRTKPSQSVPVLAKRTQLLISVRNAVEANTCVQAGVDWIDLKEPSAGSLGCPTWQVAQQVYQVLRGHARRSVALGELTNLDREQSILIGSLFPVAKVGLSHTIHDSRWSNQLAELSVDLAKNSCQLVPVIYADWQICSAPQPREVLEWAIQNAAPNLLIDTYQKAGKRLMDHLSAIQLHDLVLQGQHSNVGIVLAGSVQAQDLPTLLALKCLAIGVRGAVCQKSREGDLDAQLVLDWVKRFP